MPSWSSRLLLGTSAPSNTSSAQRSPGLESPLRKHSQPKTRSRPEAPISDSAELSSSSIRNRPIVHGRSLSHPFTSRLHEDRRTNKRVKGRDEFDGLDTTGDENSGIPPGLSRDHMLPGQTGSLQHAGKELVTGKCATCGSLVRWPKDVNVFRCIICLMVNDLSPASKAKPAANALTKPTILSQEKVLGPATARKATNVSIDRSKALVDQCISQYLQSRVDICSRDTDDDGSLLLEGFLHATEELNEGSGQETGNFRSTNTQIPAITTSIGESGSNELPDVFHGCRPSIKPTKIPPIISASTARLNSYAANAGSAGCVVSSPTRKPPPPPIDRVDNLHNHSSQRIRTSNLGYPKSIFRPLENYILTCFNTCDCLNASFLTPKPLQSARAASEGANVISFPTKPDDWHCPEESLPGLDAKTLLLGDFAENGMWWTGESPVERRRSHRHGTNSAEDSPGERASLKTARINWIELNDWYHVILSAGQSWHRGWQQLQISDGYPRSSSAKHLREIEEDMTEASIHLRRTLLKATESLLRRPGRPLKFPEDCRFLFILLANPTFYPPESFDPVSTAAAKMQRSMSHDHTVTLQVPSSSPQPNTASLLKSSDASSGRAGKYAGIIKRILGLMANTSLNCNHHFVVWFSRLSEAHFRKLVELVGSFVTYRLTRQHGRKHSNSQNTKSDLIPSIARPGAGSSAQLHAALGIAGTSKVPEKGNESIVYGEDWQIKAAARVMSLLFSANNSSTNLRHEANKAILSGPAIPGSVARLRDQSRGQLLSTSSFYNTLLDYSDLVADFETWESRRGKFSFCQYPMFLSIWAKIHIMEYDARRHMEIKAREAFFDSIMNRKAVSQHLVLKVRRDCLVEDSLRGVSEAVGSGQEEIKKGLRIEFSGEEGVDAGGLRKEWFLLLVREVFDPEHGLFTYDEESHYCYFNPNSFETSDQFFLVGAVLGLAIYNSTILDVALPPFAFRKLLASAPNYSGPTISSIRPAAGHSLEDLAELRPSLAKGLVQLLDYDGDVKDTYCWDFVVQVDRYGQPITVPLCPNGNNRPVTNANRREFVDLYVKYLLYTAVARQYEPFKRGFFTVCGGNALSLFRPEEIELLVRGSDEPLDVATLRAVAVYDGWDKGLRAEDEPVVIWFWSTFANADIRGQRRLLSFITSSDRIPAMGATNLVIKVTCLGGSCDRFPIARTCFNMIGIHRYQSREVFETKLWRAVDESEGFGLR